MSWKGIFSFSIIATVFAPSISKAEPSYCGAAILSLYEEPGRVAHDATEYISTRLLNEGGGKFGFKLGWHLFGYTSELENGFPDLDPGMKLAISSLMTLYFLPGKRGYVSDIWRIFIFQHGIYALGKKFLGDSSEVRP